jgi:hypothetical protein
MKHTHPCLCPGEVSLRLATIKDRPRTEFWIMRFGTRLHDPAPPRLPDTTWDDVRALVAHCLTVRDVAAVLSWVGVNRMEVQTLPGLVVVIGQAPIVGGWRSRVEIEVDPTKSTAWQAAVDAQKQPVAGFQLQLI